VRIRTFIATLAMLVLLAPATASAATQTREDPSDAPPGASGKADLRTVAWDVGDTSAKLTVSVDASTFGSAQRALIGVHVLLDLDVDGKADHEVVATRNADGSKVDVALRNLDGTLSTADCQDLAGKAAGPQGTVSSTIAGGRETFSFSFDPNVLPGHLASFRWAAFGQAPPDGSASGPWDVMPDVANPDPGAANPGDRRCDSAKSGVRVRMKDGIAFPDPPAPTPTPTPPPPGPAPPPVVVLALPGGQPQAGSPATIDAGGTTTAPGTHVVAYEWDMNGDGHIDTNTGPNPIAHVMTGAASQSVIVTATDSNFNRASATIVLSPGTSPAGCVPEESIGVLRIRAACIRHVGDDIVADPEPSERYWDNFVVSLNGVSLVTRDPHATVTFNVHDRTIIGHGRFRIMILNAPGGDITFLETDGFSWPLPSGAGNAGGEPASIISFEVAHSCTGADENGGVVAQCAEVPGGFPVVGHLDLGIDTDTYEATLDVNVRVGTPLEVTGRTRLRASAVLGLVLDSVGFGIANAELGPVTVDRLAFVYEPPGRGSPPHEGSMWDVAMDISLTTPPISFAGRMIFLDGRFNFAGADVSYTPGVLIYAGVFLNRIAAHFGLGPTRVGGGLGASFASILQINVNYAYAAFGDGRRAMRADGNATLAGGDLANLHMDFWSDGFISYSGRLGYSYPSFENPTFSIFGQTDYWIEPVPGADHARFQGDGDLAVLIRGVRITSMHGFINNDWAAGCALGMRGTHSYRTGYDTMAIAFPTCDVGDVSIQPTRSHDGILPPDASTAQAGDRPPARALTVARGERALILQVEGKGGAPKLTLADPKGRIYTPTTRVNKVVPDGNFVSAYLPGGNVTLLRVQHPRAGTWTLTPDVGSPAIDNVRSAKALPALHVTARVKGRGRNRVLTWNARGLGGRTIRFTERANDVGQTIVVTDKQRGHARYKIDDGAAGRRTIEAQVTTDGGVPVSTPVVARYRAPGPPRPHRPGRLKARRSHGKVTVRWPRLKGADGYVVRVTGNDGRKEVHFLSRKQRRVRILMVAPPARLKIRVAGWQGIRSIVGPARTATVKAQKAKKKKPVRKKHKRKKR
jgi:hypothetical protein